MEIKYYAAIKNNVILGVGTNSDFTYFCDHGFMMYTDMGNALYFWDGTLYVHAPWMKKLRIPNMYKTCDVKLITKLEYDSYIPLQTYVQLVLQELTPIIVELTTIKLLLPITITNMDLMETLANVLYRLCLLELGMNE